MRPNLSSIASELPKHCGSCAPKTSGERGRHRRLGGRGDRSRHASRAGPRPFGAHGRRRVGTRASPRRPPDRRPQPWWMLPPSRVTSKSYGSELDLPRAPIHHTSPALGAPGKRCLTGYAGTSLFPRRRNAGASPSVPSSDCPQYTVASQRSPTTPVVFGVAVPNGRRRRQLGAGVVTGDAPRDSPVGTVDATDRSRSVPGDLAR